MDPIETGNPALFDPAKKEIEERVIEELRQVFDPEIPVNIYELGLIYDIAVEGDNEVYIKMTLTSPNCPVAESLPVEVESRIASLAGISSTKVDIVWDPSWNPAMMSEAAKLELGMF